MQTCQVVKMKMLSLYFESPIRAPRRRLARAQIFEIMVQSGEFSSVINMIEINQCYVYIILNHVYLHYID